MKPETLLFAMGKALIAILACILFFCTIVFLGWLIAKHVLIFIIVAFVIIFGLLTWTFLPLRADK